MKPITSESTDEFLGCMMIVLLLILLFTTPAPKQEDKPEIKVKPLTVKMHQP